MSPTSGVDPGEPAARSTRTGKVFVVLLALVALAAATYFLVAMPGMDMSGDQGPTGSSRGMGGMDMRDPGDVSSGLLSPAMFTRARNGDAFVVNVHTPYAGEIAGTDAFIPFDTIAGDPRLPGARDARILLYCRSGRMSAVAARALMDAGYTRVAQLRGGMDAWRGSGRPVTTGAR